LTFLGLERIGVREVLQQRIDRHVDDVGAERARVDARHLE
jgi:hypothetical protein